MLWPLFKDKNTELQEPSVLQLLVNKPAQNETLPHPTRSGLNKECLFFIPYCGLTSLPFSKKKHVVMGNIPEGMSPNNL